ncbi:MAG TPA: ABC transporter permease [Terriglobia bacterium]|nr:ABC transporter permease [Terriglobia bacterium]
MSWRRRITRLRGLFGRRRRERELRDELRTHLALEEQENLEAGMSPIEAHYAALRRFGNVTLAEERSREMWVWNSIETFWQDIRYGLRVLVKNPGFTAVAVITLALGIGVNTTVFSVVSSMLLRKPPVPDPDRLMMLLSKNPGPLGDPSEASRWPVSAPDFVDWRAQATSFSGMAADSENAFTLSGGTEPERVPGAQVSANYFEVLGVAPLLGRVFVSGEDQAGRAQAVVLREDLWKRRFGADPRVIGRAVKVNGANYTVIGVMPDSFRRVWLFPAQIWTPLVLTADQLGPSGRGERSLSVFARLKPGVTENQARVELETVARRIAASHPESDKGWGANVMTVQAYAIAESNATTALVFLMATVGFVLLIACANLANLFLARNANRRREFAIRTALGAGRWRLARQIFAECGLLSITGGGLGLLFALWGVQVVRGALNWNDYSVLMAEGLSIDGPVLVFTLTLSVAAAMLFGLAPALLAARRDPGAGLKESSRSATAGREHHRLQSLLVMGQLALSLFLLVGAGLFVKSFIEETQTSPGMNPHGILTASIALSGSRYKDPDHQAAFYQDVRRRLESLPQVQSVAVASDLPFTFPGAARTAVEGQPVPELTKQATVGYFAISPGYFNVTQMPMREGREFTLSDNSRSAPVAIVNEAFAQKFFPNQSPLGRHVSVNREGQPVSWVPGGTPLLGASPPGWVEIVGVVSNVDEYEGEVAPRAHLFEPYLQRPQATMDVVVRTRSDPGAFADSLRRAVWSVDKDQPVTNIRTMDRVLQDSGQGDNLMAGLMGAFAGIALLMAAVGILGLMAYLVGRRTHELGVRMALGARRAEILRLVLRNSMSKALVGVGVGFVLSLGLPQLLKASFQGYHVHSGWILAGTPLAVLLVALAACYLPARRASRVDPREALRCE